MKYTSEHFRDYFLGIIADEDAEMLERSFMENGELQEAVLSAESLLIDEYLDGDLSLIEQKQFLNNYLVTEARKQRVAEIRTYRVFFQNKIALKTKLEPVQVTNTSFLADVFDWFTAKGLVTAGAIAILLLVGTVALVVFNRDSDDIVAKYATINKQDMTDLSRFTAMSKLLLVPGSQRGLSDGSKVKTGGAAEVLVRLALSPRVGVHDRFHLNIKRGSVDIYSQSGLRSYDNSNGMELRIVLPTLLLERGEHQIVVTSASDPQNVMKYAFSVE